ncbi:PREDICTED: indole-3-acetic acid-amido synthetase GH3.6-like isoform X2 [Priapulus caudatus]|uniref:Indole-3-acetic acid-amido synthetase GH3.6-like isoform X2 n=1 Tax=Priapulus caudatus TaxID=37621 RepID=A0ABM1EEQ9_PRICU|nr:PREDICTED: indole-3-acetic acid-amido synthetase GH3.6-like isoform X2 [Priapulus caudatus]
MKGRPLYLTLTSGTTARLNTYRRLFGSLQVLYCKFLLVAGKAVRDLLCKTPSLQRHVVFSYKTTYTYSPAGIPISQVTDVPLKTNYQEWARVTLTTPPCARDISTDQEIIYIHLLFALRDRYLYSIDAVFASTVYYAFVLLEQRWMELVEDIRLGKVNPTLNIEKHVRHALNEELEPMPERATELANEFYKGFDAIVLRIWPHCHVINAATAGSLAMFTRSLRSKYCRYIPVFSPVFASTEVCLGVNLWPLDEVPNFCLTPSCSFHEFIPEANADEDQPKTLFSDQVKVGQTYEVVATSLNPLYRYRTGDLVTIRRFYEQAPVFEYRTRKGALFNIRGEKVTDVILTTAIKNCSKKHWNDKMIIDFVCCDSHLVDNLGAEYATTGTLPCYYVFLNSLME